MRKALLLIGFILLAACSVDHVVVAELEAASGGDSADAGASGASEGGSRVMSSGGAGNGGTPSNGGTSDAASGGTSGGSAALGGNDSDGVAGSIFWIGSGGVTTNVDISDAAGAGGATFYVVCSCLGDAAHVCGSDGFTYDATCGDNSCLPDTIECLHACPCTPNEPATDDQLFPQQCAQSRCQDGFSCLRYSSTRNIQTSCGSTI